MAMQMRKYAVHADYAHIREYADAAENLIHINHIKIFYKHCHDEKWVKILWLKMLLYYFFF